MEKLPHGYHLKCFTSRTIIPYFPQLTALGALIFGRSQREYFQWRFSEAFSRPQSCGIFFGKELVAFAGMNRMMLQSSGKVRQCALLGYACVHPEHRRKGLMKRILHEYFLRIQGLYVSFPSKETERCFKKYGGFVKVFHLQKYVKVYHPLSTASYFFRKYQHRQPAFFLQERELSQRFRQFSLGSLAVRRIKKFSKRHIDLLSSYYQQVQFKKDIAFLNWRYFSCPHEHYLVLELSNRGAAVGLIVLQFSFLNARYVKGKIFEQIIADAHMLKAVDEVAKQFHAAFIICPLKDPSRELMLKKNGYLKALRTVPVLFGSNRKSDLIGLENVALQFGDSDLD